MLAVDTETTGLYLRNGCTTFAIGAYDGSTFFHQCKAINPHTRYRIQEFSSTIRSRLDAADIVLYHNAHFDIAALCEAGVYDWEEPNTPSFWSKILDTTSLAHLHCSTDSLALDSLTLKYLNKGYPEDTELTLTVNKCRAIARSQKPDWLIADGNKRHPSMNPCAANTRWNRMDYWLPQAVAAGVPECNRPDLPTRHLNTVMLKYLRADVTNTYELAQHLFSELITRHDTHVTDLLSINKNVEHITWKMESSGLWVHPVELQEAIEGCQYYIEVLKKKVYELSQLEHITDTSLRDLLFQKWILEPVKHTKKTYAPSVDAHSLLKLHVEADIGSDAREFLACYLSLKKYEKKLTSLTSYSNSRNSSGRIHPSYFIVGTKTCRMSARNPNPQNITKAGNPYEDDAPDIAHWLKASPQMRSVFGPPPGYWWLSADYSQLQLRIFAFITQEQEMIDAFDAGWDAHNFMAKKIFNTSTPNKAQRRVAKNVNFGFIFGASPWKIEETAGIPGLWDIVTELFPNAHAFIEETKKSIEERGFVETFGGYPLELKEHINKRTGQLEKAAHAGVNFIVQGAEGIIVKRAMFLTDNYLTEHYPAGKVALQVHDELNFEVPEKCPKKHIRNLKLLMEQAAYEYGLTAPVEIDLVTHRWDKESKIKL